MCVPNTQKGRLGLWFSTELVLNMLAAYKDSRRLLDIMDLVVSNVYFSNAIGINKILS